MVFATLNGFGAHEPTTGRIDLYSPAGEHLTTTGVSPGRFRLIGERDGKFVIYGDHPGLGPAETLVFRELPDFQLVVPFMDGRGIYLGCDDEIEVLDGSGHCVEDLSFAGVEVVSTKWPSGFWINRSEDDDDNSSVLMHELERLACKSLPRFHRAWHSGGQFLGLEGRIALWQFSPSSAHSLQRRFPERCHQLMDVGCNAGGCSAIAIRGDEIVGLLAHGDGDFEESFVVPYWHEWVIVGGGTHAVFSDGRIFEFAARSWRRWSEGSR
jgi:hypothetical protein